MEDRESLIRIHLLPIRFYLYGAEAPAAVARDEPLWQSWINERFPAVGADSSLS
ncbi:MAG: hypothetical protein ACREEM_53120 [Blastocatellia bacterium]